MSIRYDVASVLILKLTVSPVLMLMSVAKPWMAGSFPPVRSQSVSPVKQFSATIAFAGLGHPAPCARTASRPESRPVSTSAAVTASMRRVRGRRALCRIVVTVIMIQSPRRRRSQPQGHAA